MEREIIKNELQENSLWTAVNLSWLEVSIKNKEKLDIRRKSKICIVFCPLYKIGDINLSDILDFGQKIEESRVFGKLKAYKSVLDTLIPELGKSGFAPLIEFVLANKGVLLERNADSNDLDRLKYHSVLYKQLVASWAAELGFNYQFSDYFEKGVGFPTFVSMKNEIPTEIQMAVSEPKSEPFLLIEYINEYLKKSDPIINNSDNRHVAKSLIKALGLTGAFWLTAGYVAFDNKISGIVGDNGMYLVSERFDPLFAISKFTPSLEKLTRIQIKA